MPHFAFGTFGTFALGHSDMVALGSLLGALHPGHADSQYSLSSKVYLEHVILIHKIHYNFNVTYE